MNSSSCVVCKRIASQSQTVCQNCREFYIRTYNQARRWKCIRRGICEFHSQSPYYCRSCRFKRCAMAKIPISTKHSRRGHTCVPYFEHPDIQMRMEEISMALYPKGIQMLKKVNGFQTSVEFVNRMAEFEKVCNNLSAGSPSEVDANLEVELGDVLYNPESCSSRQTAGWDHWQLSELKNDLQYQMKNSYARLVTLYADFASSVPEIFKLQAVDRLKLAQQNFMAFVSLTKMYYSWKEKVPLDTTLKRAERYRSDQEDSRIYRNTINSVAQSHKETVSKSLDELAITDQELVILKIICIFASPYDLSYDGYKIVNIARDRYSVILSDYLKSIYPDRSAKEHSERLADLLRVVTDIKIVSEAICRFFEVMFAKNIGQLQGSLTYDIHMRRY